MNYSAISIAALAAGIPLAPVHAEAAVANSNASSAVAEAAAGEAEPTPGSAKDAHPDPDQAIVVTGIRRQAGDVLGGVSVLDEEELAHDLKPSLGDTLADLPGVSASSFGPTASRPILRGLSGERVGVLTDGIGALDLSSSDPDHAVAINPLTAERIEVLRGPGALLFGSSAIGGVVNVIDKRIPRKVPDKAVAVDASAAYGSAANERSASASVDVSLGGHFVAHADGAYSNYDDLHIGGHVLSEPLREQALASPDPAIRALAALKDKLPNTAGRSGDLAAGIAYVDGETNIGISIGQHSFRYGVPIRFSLDPSIEPEQPTLDGRQTRGDVRANVPIGGAFKMFELRGGIAKYHHDELDPTGAIGSSFFSTGGEMRADVVQTEREGWGGTTGIQYLNQSAHIRGEEKYLPDSRRHNLGLFTLQTLARGPVRFEGGARVEFARLHAGADAQIAANGGPIGLAPLDRSFTTVSGSAGANYLVGADWRVGLSLSHSERSPAIDEIFSNGPHGGSQQFLIGNPDLKTEKSNGVELSVHRTTGPVHVQGSIYYSRFSNFIFQSATGANEGGLPIYDYRQGKAEYYGFEVESDAKFGRAWGIDWGGEVVADAVRAKIRNFGPAPEIPPFRVLAGLTGSRGQIDGRVEVERVSSQRRAAPNETSTRGYTTVGASLDWHPFAENPELTLSLQGNNLFDVDARRHASDLKDFAPLAGRDIRLSARLAL